MERTAMKDVVLLLLVVLTALLQSSSSSPLALEPLVDVSTECRGLWSVTNNKAENFTFNFAFDGVFSNSTQRTVASSKTSILVGGDNRELRIWSTSGTLLYNGRTNRAGVCFRLRTSCNGRWEVNNTRGVTLTSTWLIKQTSKRETGRLVLPPFSSNIFYTSLMGAQSDTLDLYVEGIRQEVVRLGSLADCFPVPTPAPRVPTGTRRPQILTQ
eukprot:TRINITY_DN3615_c0_g1_i1.p1 TRINITY_DN3615_c0_g1~~TRINITY_DN3615_c0_g1_i1.p1  ORF type:complete len:213 (+),score=61.65 TRINITY_DN3615_c0_g1_i1:59-697(+)